MRPMIVITTSISTSVNPSWPITRLPASPVRATNNPRILLSDIMMNQPFI